MRVIGEIPHPACKITLFQWNEKFIIKVEQGLLEQSFKVNRFDIREDQEIKKLVNDEFMNTVLANFKTMHQALKKSMDLII